MKKAKTFFKSNFLTRPLYMTLFYIYFFGVETAIKKIKNKVNKKIIKKQINSNNTERTCCEEEEHRPQIGSVHGYNKLYVNNTEVYKEYFEREWCHEEMRDTMVVDGGIIMPIDKTHKGEYGGEGGVYSRTGEFITRHVRIKGEKENAQECTVTDELDYIPETVVYGGVFIEHFGHIVVECLSRMWWYIENNSSNYKCVFVSMFDQIGDVLIELLELLGIPRENIVICNVPTRFDSVIIPDQATIITAGYNMKQKLTYDTIRDSVKLGNYEKVYLTRTGLSDRDTVNEEYFENVYRNLGFQVISPEKLSIQEQVSIMSGVKELVCTEGSLGHQIAFCQDGVQLTILNKQADHPNLVQCWLNHLRGAKCTYIDVSANFMPASCHASGSILMPTTYWKMYTQDNYGNDLSVEDVDINEFALEYIKLWAQKAAIYSQRPDQSNIMRTWTLAEIVININEMLLCEKLDENVKNTIYDVLSCCCEE